MCCKYAWHYTVRLFLCLCSCRPTWASGDGDWPLLLCQPALVLVNQWIHKVLTHLVVTLVTTVLFVALIYTNYY